MNERTTNYVVDSRCFNGTVQTAMRDGIHCDYSGRTIEQIRAENKNPHLIVVSDSRANLLLKRYQRSLEQPFREITRERYYELMECVPPKRLSRDYFFVGECHYGLLYRFCFELNGRFYSGLRVVKTPEKELYGQMREFGEVVSHRAELIKAGNYVHWGKKYTPYAFIDRFGKVNFIQNLIDTGNKAEYESDRRGLSEVLQSLRKNNYRYLKFHGRYNNVFDLFEWIRENKFTVEIHGELLDFNPNGFVDFHGNLCEYSAAFRYRIYDREIVRQVIYQLRTVKREFSWKR